MAWYTFSVGAVGSLAGRLLGPECVFPSSRPSPECSLTVRLDSAFGPTFWPGQGGPPRHSRMRGWGLPEAGAVAAKVIWLLHTPFGCFPYHSGASRAVSDRAPESRFSGCMLCGDLCMQARLHNSRSPERPRWPSSSLRRSAEGRTVALAASIRQRCLACPRHVLAPATTLSRAHGHLRPNPKERTIRSYPRHHV